MMCSAAIIAVFTYQPAVFILFIFPALRFFRDLTHRSANNELLSSQIRLLVSLTIAYLAAIVNAAAVYIYWNSPRAEAGFDLKTKIEYFFNTALPRTISAPLLMNSWTTSIAVIAVGFILGASIFAFRHQHIRETSKLRRSLQLLCWFLVVTHLSVATALPVALLPENAIDFRRYSFGSISSTLILIALTHHLSGTTTFLGARWRQFLSFAIPVIIGVVVLIGYRNEIVQVPKQEWAAAKCAAKRTDSIPEIPIVLNNSELAAAGFSNSLSDEFGVASLPRPVAGAMLVWNAHQSLDQHAKNFSPWDIQIEISDRQASPWGRAFTDCFANN